MNIDTETCKHQPVYFGAININIDERTIGSVDENNRGMVGIEYSFNSYLTGEDGEALHQKIAGNYWKPIYDGTEKSPKNGYDIFYYY